MLEDEKINILLVDDQPGKLLSYETILSGMKENIFKASSGREALEYLLKNDIAVILIDVCMPDLDGFQLAAMIREHPRYRQTAIIFISAIFLSDLDSLRGYEMGAVDYVSVPIVPEVLRAKVKVFTELYRKTRELELLNHELEQRVSARTLELEESNRKLRESENRRSHALSAGQMGSWEWNRQGDRFIWDEGQHRIFGTTADIFNATTENIQALIHPEDREVFHNNLKDIVENGTSGQFEFRIVRPGERVRWCLASAAATTDKAQKVQRVSGVTFDITDRKEAEERQNLLAREVDHRAKNTLAVVQSILRLSRADNVSAYMSSVEGRVHALSRAHNLLSQSRWRGVWLRGLIEEELAPYRSGKITLNGPPIALRPVAAQSLALAIHELSTNAAKYGALSSVDGRLSVEWSIADDNLAIEWQEMDGPTVSAPKKGGFGTNILFGSVEKQLSGSVKMDWHSTGLACHVLIPAGANIETNDFSPARDEYPEQVSLLEDPRQTDLQALLRPAAAGG